MGASDVAACDGTSDGDGGLMATTLAKAHARELETGTQ